MRLLVAGVTGQLGQALLAASDERDIEVVALVRPMHGRPADERVVRLLRHFPGLAERTVEGDVRHPRWGLDKCTIADLGDSVDAILDLAAETDWSASAGDHRATNVGGALNGHELALALQRAGGRCKFYWYASSVHVAGGREGLIPELPASADPHRTPYEQSKWIAEQQLLSRAHEHPEIQLAIARIGGLVGSRSDGATTRRNSLYLLADRWDRLPGVLLAPARGRVDMLPRDVCAEILLDAMLAARPGAAPEILHVCAGEDAPTLRSLLATAESLDLDGRLRHRRTLGISARLMARVIENADRAMQLSPTQRNLLTGLRYVTLERIFERDRLRSLLGKALPKPDAATLARLVFGLPHPESQWDHRPESLSRFAG